MARSHHVYIVEINHRPRAAFTVKHECKSWLLQNYPKVPTNLRVIRLPDGGRGVDLDITAELVGL